jgi:hypothetical protein
VEVILQLEKLEINQYQLYLKDYYEYSNYGLLFLNYIIFHFFFYEDSSNVY